VTTSDERHFVRRQFLFEHNPRGLARVCSGRQIGKSVKRRRVARAGCRRRRHPGVAARAEDSSLEPVAAADGMQARRARRARSAVQAEPGAPWEAVGAAGHRQREAQGHSMARRSILTFPSLTSSPRFSESLVQISEASDCRPTRSIPLGLRGIQQPCRGRRSNSPNWTLPRPRICPPAVHE